MVLEIQSSNERGVYRNRRKRAKAPRRRKRFVAFETTVTRITRTNGQIYTGFVGTRRSVRTVSRIRFFIVVKLLTSNMVAASLKPRYTSDRVSCRCRYFGTSSWSTLLQRFQNLNTRQTVCVCVCVCVGIISKNRRSFVVFTSISRLKD